MADEMKKNPNQQSGEQRQGQDYDQRQQKGQQDPSKKQPSNLGQDVDDEQENEQQGGQRRAS
jgi:hypothetical protein